jgi:ribose transport system substrate-binding protein
MRVIRVSGIVAITITVLATACGQDQGDQGTGGVTGTSPDEPFTIGLSHYALPIAHFQVFTDAVEAKAEEFGWNLVVTDSGFNPEKQVDDISDLLTQGVDLILAAPGDKGALVPAYLEAMEAGVPIISIGQVVAPPGDENQLTWIGLEWPEVGALRATRLVELIGGSGKVILIRGPSGLDFVQGMGDGAESVWSQNPGVEIVTEQFADSFTPEEGLRLAEDALTTNPDADAIWAETDDLALGVVQAVRERGIPFDEIVIVSQDGAAAAMAMIRKGELDITMAVRSYLWGDVIMEVAREYLENGVTPPPFVEVELVEVSLENLDEYMAICEEFPMEKHCEAA